DGTTAGTVLVKDIRPGSAGSGPINLTSFNGRAYFTADDGTSGRELWMSDGTAAGTVLVQDIRPGSVGAFSPSGNPYLTSANGRLFSGANDGIHGTELWAFPPPQTVQSVVTNDGSPQRSHVTSITVTFSGLVTLDPGAFDLLRQGADPVGVDVATS